MTAGRSGPYGAYKLVNRRAGVDKEKQRERNRRAGEKRRAQKRKENATRLARKHARAAAADERLLPGEDLEPNWCTDCTECGCETHTHMGMECTSIGFDRTKWIQRCLNCGSRWTARIRRSDRVKRLAPLALALLFAGCAGDGLPVYDAPTVALYLGDQVDAGAALHGARVWEDLGFAVDVAGDVAPRQCPRQWETIADTDCEISIVIELATADELDGRLGRALPAFRQVWILDTVTDPATVARIVGHEVGHVVLDTADHLEAGAGVMAWTRPTDAITAGDRELACDSLGFCP